MDEVKDYYLAELSYFNTDISDNKKVGIEKVDSLKYGSTDPLSYVLLITDDGINYSNAFNENENYHTYRHSKEPQYHLFSNGDLEIVGFKIMPTNKDTISEAGPCWLLTDTVYKDRTLDEMKDFICNNSRMYFKDMHNYLTDIELLTYHGGIEKLKKRKRMIEYFNNHGVNDFDCSFKNKVFCKKR